MGSVKTLFHKVWLFLVVCCSVFLVKYHHDSINRLSGNRKEITPRDHSGISSSLKSLLGIEEAEYLSSEEHVKKSQPEKRKAKLISVGYFERLRSYWIYHRLFEPFKDPVTCDCANFGTVSKVMFSKIADIGNFDIVVFPYDVATAPGISNTWKRIRKQHRHSQRWVYATWETPYKLTKSLIPDFLAKNTFHWSCTYRTSSDIPVPYGYFKRYDKPKQRDVQNWARNKTSLLAWMSTNSAKQWHRRGLIENLLKTVEIDIYGGKTGIKCPRNSSECDDKIESHKFYLALENSCCREYVSEKFWRTLALNTVPIVVGPPKSDYLNVAPPNSFIYADDFVSVEDLVSYLRYVDNNDTLYNEYFKWKRYGYVVNLSRDKDQSAAQSRKEPPMGLYYSCDTACKMAELYRKETDQHRKRYFNPRSKQWAGSCGPCAKHTWISQFEYAVNQSER